MRSEGLAGGGCPLQSPLAVAELLAVLGPEPAERLGTRQTHARWSLAGGLPACSLPGPDRWQEITVALEQTCVMAVS